MALVPAASGAFRPGTTEPTQEIRVEVTLTDSGIKLSHKVGERGWVALFVVRNKGTKPHSFEVAGKGGLALQANVSFKNGLATPVMKPGSKFKVLLIFLDVRGALAYRSYVPADLKNPRMRGTFTIR